MDHILSYNLELSHFQQELPWVPRFMFFSSDFQQMRFNPKKDYQKVFFKGSSYVFSIWVLTVIFVMPERSIQPLTSIIPPCSDINRRTLRNRFLSREFVTMSVYRNTIKLDIELDWLRPQTYLRDQRKPSPPSTPSLKL